MLQISKCKGHWSLGLYTFWVLAKREPLHNGDFREKKCVSPAETIGIWHCVAVRFSQVPKKCTDLDLSLLYILKLRTNSQFAKENNFLALSACFRSPARELAAGLLRQDHVYKTTDELFRFHNQNFDEMHCKLDSTENPRSFEKYPTPH